MENLVSCSDVSKIDKQSQEIYNIPAIVLMEQAGLKAWQFIKEKIDLEEPLVIVAGGGNNGGDGLVIAREAINDGVKDILVVLCGHHISESCSVHRKIIESYGIPTINVDGESLPDEVIQSISTASYLVDAIVGTGLKSSLKEVAAALVTSINQSNAIKFSIDVPSGLSDDVSVSHLAVKSDYTLCMGPLKSLYFDPSVHVNCGTIIKINPSFPSVLVDSTKPSAYLANDEEPSLVPLEADAYKKSRGHLAIFGGSKKYTGAVRLASRSAFVSRVGLVTTFCDEEIYPIVATESPSVIVHSLNDFTSLNNYNAILAGPGWGSDREDLLLSLIESMKPLVIDADGIRCFASLFAEGKIAGHGTIILTPHLGELRALSKAIFPNLEFDLGKDNTPKEFLDLLSQLSVTTGAIIIFKSEVTFVCTPARKPMAICGDNPSLGVAGSGDVLAGCIAGLLAGGLSPFKSAMYGVLWHSEAGKETFKEHGYYDSETLIDILGKVISK